MEMKWQEGNIFTHVWHSGHRKAAGGGGGLCDRESPGQRDALDKDPRIETPRTKTPSHIYRIGR